MVSRNTQGFSLFELMIVMIISGILAAASWSYADRQTTSFQLKQASELLTSLLETYRIQSILKRSTTQIAFQNNQLVVRQKLDGNSKWEEPNTVHLSKDTRFFSKSAVSFYSTGFASPKTIQLTKNHTTHYLVVNINGRIRYEKPE